MAKTLYILAIMLVLGMVFARAQSTGADVYAAEDKQTRDLKIYMDAKISTLSDDTKKFLDNLFQTWDNRMQVLSKSLSVQMAIVLFCATMLANLITMVMRNHYERKLLDIRYNSLLEREMRLVKKEMVVNIAPQPAPEAPLKPLQSPETQAPAPNPEPSEQEVKSPFKLFKSKPKDKENTNFLKGVK